MSRRPSRSLLKVGVASSDWSSSVFDDRGWPVPGGANWIRFTQNQSEMRNPVVIGELIESSGRLGVQTWDNRSHFDCSVIFMQRQMDDWVPNAILNARLNGQIVVNDVDDWFWGLHPENQASTAVDPLLNPRSNIDHYRKSLMASNLVTTSTSFLADVIGSWGVKTHVVANGVTVWHFTPRQHRPGTPIIGWCGSTAHRSGDLEVVARSLRAMRDKVRFHHTGDYAEHPSFAGQVGLADKEVSVLPLLAPLEYPSGFVFDIGIVPLSDVVFNMAKSWIKGIEYAAAGIPFVASPSDEYKRLQRRYGIGRLAETPDEWVAHFTDLLDPEVRAEEAKRNRAVVEEQLDARTMARQWDDLVWEIVP